MSIIKSKITTDSRTGPIDCRFAGEIARKKLIPKLEIFINPEKHGNYCELVKQNPARSVWKCEIDGLNVFLKQFHSKSPFKTAWTKLLGGDAERELNVSDKLLSNGVNSQQVLMAAKGPNCSWIVTKTVNQAELLCDLREKVLSDDNPRKKQQTRQTISAVASLIAKMHNCGIGHMDLHSGNIMFDGEKIAENKFEPIICDLHRTSGPTKLSRLAACHDLAKFDHDFINWLSAADRLRFLKKYLQQRTRPKGTMRGWALITMHLSQRHRQKFLKARDKRIRTNNSYFYRFKSPQCGLAAGLLKSKNRTKTLPETFYNFSKKGWREVFSNPEALLDKTAGEVIKDSPSALVIRRKMDINGNKIDSFIKLSRNKKKWKFALTAIRKSRSRRAFELSHQLIQRGVNCALPLGFCEKRIFRFLKFNILITANFHNSQSAVEFINSHCKSADHKTKRAALKTAAKLIRKLHDCGFTHRDLKASNVLMRQNDGGDVEVALIDMDGACRPLNLGMDKRLSNLGRFIASLWACKGFTQQDQEFIITEYLGPDGLNVIDVKLCNALMAPAISHKRNKGQQSD